ncbi:hypothetical protein [Endobacter medicaginis]|uniref:hypothetical protein n=1 Tax=Endobacter medicaginis TaxID=1181271 RepID=UPI001C3FFD7C|nr:hypothetical protein [Endobacter medicaginis]
MFIENCYLVKQGVPWSVAFGDSPLSAERRLAAIAVLGAMDGRGEYDFDSGRWMKSDA